ncbi:MAG: SDR family oxidoreductase [Acidobacteria bacterium]|nr:SDR family oxidoreductase [Acidobacteriota bacterium]
MMASLNGKVALVTGASSGIGRATALELGRQGASIAVHYFQRQQSAERVAREICDRGVRADVFQADVSKTADARALVEAAWERFGAIDILINNAGDLVERRSLTQMSQERWRQVIDLNLSSVFFCCQAVAPRMIERRTGVIVNVSSVAAHNGGGPGALAYAAAKGGVISLTKAIAKELAPHGIRVNAVSPGLIDNTAFHERFTPRENFEAIARTVPLGRAGQPGDVASVIVFLVRDESAYLVGETIEINGGMFMK